MRKHTLNSFGCPQFRPKKKVILLNSNQSLRSPNLP
jgi:hypothetical protein